MNVSLNTCFTVVLCKQRFASLPSNSLLLSLAVVDLLTGVIAQTSFAVENFLFSQCIFSNALDKFVAVTGYLLGTMSYTTILLVSLDRYVAILHPFFYAAQVTKSRLIRAQMLTWLVPLSLIIFSILNRDHSVLFYVLFSFSVTIWLLAIYIYGKIVAVACSIVRNERKIKNAITVSMSQNSLSASSRDSKHCISSTGPRKLRDRKFAMQRESRRIMTTVFCVMSALVATLTPITIFSLCMITTNSGLRGYREQIILHWVQSISLVNGLLNPLIYCFRMTEIRRAFFRLVGISKW